MLETLIHEPEGKTLEFKRDLSTPKNFLKTLVAFANTAGGRLIFGVADASRQVIGVENPLDEEERLCNQIADAMIYTTEKNLKEFGNKIYYYENTDGGHSGAANLTESARKSALEYVFLSRKLMD